jgi:hypothetical protein
VGKKNFNMTRVVERMFTPALNILLKMNGNESAINHTTELFH